MSSTENQYLWQPFEKCKKHLKTTVKIRMTECEESISKKIHLEQEPSETLTLNTRFEKFNHHDYSSRRYHVIITLVFDNELHVLSSDYIYEIEMKFDYSNGPSFYSNLKKCRTSEELEFTKTLPFNFYGESEGFCLTISRYNRINELERCPYDWAINEMLLKNGTYSDVSLFVGNKEFRVHKDILSLKSTVFERMFLQEMSENQNGKVDIKDFDTEVIAEMIFYIYTCRIQHLEECYVELFKAAHMYNVIGLISVCEEYMEINMSCENIVDILNLATLYNRDELRSKATLFVKKHETELVKVESYQNFLCRNFEIMTVASVLILCEKYEMSNVKSEALEFIKINKKDIPKNKTCFDTLESYPKLLKEIILYIET